ncbi:MAG: tetratricopeptide repeat protein [Candidatus Sumerlaeaceae bacterium]|nr:tetratricopeptide repeat protein [Candidatus Sumerlaeaceae bacterium]
MSSMYPPEVIADLNGQIEIHRLMELIGYRVEKLVDAGETIRGFCPIHRDKLFKTLLIDKFQRSFRCTHSLCPGTAGGNLITLYSMATKTPIDDAVQKLAGEFGLELSVPLDPDYVERNLEVAENYLELGAFDEAEKAYRNLLTLNPDLLQAHEGLLSLYDQQKRLAEIAETRQTLAQLHLAQGSLDKALEQAKALVAANPGDPKGQLLLADCSLKIGDSDSALDCLMAAADLFEAEGNFDGALQAYLKVDDLNTEIVDVIPHIVQVYQHLGDPGRAVEHLAAKAARAAEEGRFARATEHYVSALELAPDRTDIQSRYIECAARSENPDEVMPKVFEVIDNWVKQDRVEPAIEGLRTILDVQPRNGEALTRLTEIYRSRQMETEAGDLQVHAARLKLESGETAAARDELEKLLRTQPENVRAMRLVVEACTTLPDRAAANAWRLKLGDILAGRNDHAEAVAEFDAILEAEPELLSVREKRADSLEKLGLAGNIDARARAGIDFGMLAEAYCEQTNSTRAIRFFEKATAIQQGGPDLLLKMARAYVRARAHNEALDAFTRACDQLVSEGRVSDAVGEAAQFQALLPGNARLSWYVADLATRAGDNDDAVKRYQALAASLAGTGESAEAVRALEKALSLQADNLACLEQWAAIASSQADTAKRAEILLRIAGVHEAAGDHELAAKAVNEVIAADPGNVDAAHKLLNLYERIGKTVEAGEMRIRLSDMYRKTGNAEGELRLLREAVAQEPGNEPALGLLIRTEYDRGHLAEGTAAARQLAALQLAAGRAEEARATLADAVARTPDDIAANQELFNSLAAGGQKGEAIARGKHLVELLAVEDRVPEAVELYTRIVECDPKNLELKYEEAKFLRQVSRPADAADRLFKLAKLHLKAKATTKAEAVLLEITGEDPGNIPAMEQLISIYTGNNDVAKAEEQLCRLASARQSAGKNSDAVESLRRAIELNPESIRARRQLIQIFRMTSQAAEVMAELEALSKCYTTMGADREALETDQEAVAFAPNDLAARRRLADSHLRRNDMRAGIAELEQIVSLHADNKEFDKALCVIDEILAMAPEELGPRRLRGEIYSKMGDETRAREEFRLVTARTRLRQAQQHAGSGDFDRQARVLRDALTFASDDVEILRELVNCDFARGDAVAACATARRLAAIYLQAGESQRAQAVLLEALERSPEDVETNRDLFELQRDSGMKEDAISRGLNLVELLTRDDRNDEAAKTYEEIAACEPNNLTLRINHVDFLKRIGRTSEALDRQFALARLQREREKHDEAESLLLDIVASDPADVRARQELVSLYEYLGNRDKIEEQQCQLADAFHAQGDLQNAITTLQAVLESDPEGVESRRQLVRYYIEQGRVEDAVANLHTLADIQRKRGSDREALDAEREAVGLAPANVTARRRLATAFLKAGDRPLAVNELDQLATIYIETEEFPDALATLDELLAIEPDRMASRVQRAELLARTGNADRALEEFRALSARLKDGPVAGPASSQPMLNEGALQIVKEYDFEHFVVGANNNFAHATARAVAQAPARAYNPLFLYSDVGLGKTHLVNAIANHILTANPLARIIYTNSEDFTGELVSAIQNNTIMQFRSRYKSVDLLIVDDVQFLAGKERAQEEFFHIFNALFQAKRQIVVTSDRPPKDIAHLESRLRSRFSSGVIVDIAAPDLETRIAILNREIEALGLKIDAPIPALLAERVDSNVRELKGALNQLTAMRDMRGLAITEDNVRQMLDNLYARA